MKKKNHDRGEGQTALTFSLSEELKERIEAAAKSERRSKSNWIVLTLEQILKDMEESGKLPKVAPSKQVKDK